MFEVHRPWEGDRQGYQPYDDNCDSDYLGGDPPLHGVADGQTSLYTDGYESVDGGVH